MAISRFESPIATNFQPTYVSQYVPMPTDFIQNSLENKQRQFDEAEAQTYTLQTILNNVKSDPATQDYIQAEIDKKYAEPLTSLATELADKGSSDYQARLNAITRQFQTDPLVRVAKNNAENYKLYQEARQKNPEKYSQIYDPYQKYVNQVQQTGQVQPFNFAGMKVMEDWNKDFNTYVDKISDEGYLNEYYENNKGNPIVNQFGQLAKRKSGQKGVTELKVLGVAMNAAQSALKGKTGRSFIDNTLQRDTEETGINPNQTYRDTVIEVDNKGNLNYIEKDLTEDQYVYNQAVKDLFARGLKNAGVQTTNGIDLENLPEYMMKQEEDIDLNLGMRNSEKLVKEKISSEILEGLPKKNAINILTGQPGAKTPEEYALQRRLAQADKQEVEDYTFTPEQQVSLQKASRELKKTPKNNQERIELLNEYSNWKSQISTNAITKRIPFKQAEGIQKQLIDGRGLTDVNGILPLETDSDNIRQNEIVAGNKIFEEYSPEEYDYIVTTNELAVGNPYGIPKANLLTIEKEGKKVAEFAIPRKYNSDDAELHNMYQSKYSGQGRSEGQLAVNGKLENVVFDYEIETDKDKQGNLNRKGEILKVYRKDGNNNLTLLLEPIVVSGNEDAILKFYKEKINPNYKPF